MNIDDLLIKYPREKHNLISILHDIQNTSVYNYISEDNMKSVAEYLNIPHSSVYGLITYYSMFSTSPRGENIIRVCRSPICKIFDDTDILSFLENRLNIKSGETTLDKKFTLEEAECLGCCDKVPAMMINKELHYSLNEEKIIKILNLYI